MLPETCSKTHRTQERYVTSVKQREILKVSSHVQVPQSHTPSFLDTALSECEVKITRTGAGTQRSVIAAVHQRDGPVPRSPAGRLETHC